MTIRKIYLRGIPVYDPAHILLGLEDGSGVWLFEDGLAISWGDLERKFKVTLEGSGMSRREAITVIEPQGVDSDAIPYTCYLPTGTSPSAVTVTAWDINLDGTYTDVTATVMPTGTVVTSGDVITTKPLTALTLGHTYRIVIAFTSGGIPMSNYFDVRAEK